MFALFFLACRILYRCRVASEQTASKTHQQRHSFVNGTASSWNQLVVSYCFFVFSWKWISWRVTLFGIDIETCLEFLTGKEIEQFQWIDNSVWRFLTLLSWFRNVWCIETWTKFLRARWKIRDASKTQNLMLTLLQTTRGLRQKHRGEVEKQDVFACHWDGRHSETARPSEQRRQVPCGRSNLHQKKKHADVFSGETSFQRQVLKWRYEDWKIPNGESMIKTHRFKEECVELPLLNMRQHGMTSTYRDECIKFYHALSRPLLVKKCPCPLRSEGSLFQGCWNWIYRLFAIR